MALLSISLIFLRCLRFRGLAKRTRYGDSCLAWDTPEIGFWFDSEQIRSLGPLTKDNRYCRNPDEAEAPWCLVGILFKFNSSFRFFLRKFLQKTKIGYVKCEKINVPQVFQEK